MYGSSPHSRGTRPLVDDVLKFFQDHPRTRGEHSIMPRSAYMQGRIIPALAGNTEASYSLMLFDRDHPRTRGEHLKCGWLVMTVKGSSPHSRGTLPSANDLQVDTADHPRTRGEHCHASARTCITLGSSPHSRGTLFFVDSRLHDFRIIPALAGNTQRLSLLQNRVGDHPRTRGEHASPSYPKEGHPRIIPALAGNTPR